MKLTTWAERPTANGEWPIARSFILSGLLYLLALASTPRPSFDNFSLFTLTRVIKVTKDAPIIDMSINILHATTVETAETAETAETG